LGEAGRERGLERATLDVEVDVSLRGARVRGHIEELGGIDGTGTVQ
jgi:hypothetical protein